MIDYNFVALPKIYRFLSGNELKVFVTIFDQWSQMKNEDGWYYRSQKHLCEDSNLPLRTLQRTIKKLIEKEVIFTTIYNDGVKMASYNKANEYKINMDKVLEMSEKKGVKSVKEGCQNGAPSKNKEIKNKKNIMISKVITTDDETLQDKKDNNNNLNLSDMKENEMSDNGTNVMNAMSEQSERQAKENESSGCVKENEINSSTQEDIKTSTSGNDNTTSIVNDGNSKDETVSNTMNVVNPDNTSKVKANGNSDLQANDPFFNEECSKSLPEPPTPLPSLNDDWDDEDIFKAAGEPQSDKMEQLPTVEEKDAQSASKCPQIKLDEKWYKETYVLMNSINTIKSNEDLNEILEEMNERIMLSKSKRLLNDFQCAIYGTYGLTNGRFQDKASQMIVDLARVCS